EAAGQDPILFGDTFLRSAYVVYDLQENSIGLAQTNFNATDSNIQAFPSSGGIPGASTTVSAVTVTQTNTNRVLPSASQTVPGAGMTGGVTGTSRSATFAFCSATGSSSKNAAAPSLGPSA